MVYLITFLVGTVIVCFYALLISSALFVLLSLFLLCQHIYRSFNVIDREKERKEYYAKSQTNEAICCIEGVEKEIEELYDGYEERRIEDYNILKGIWNS